VGTSFAKPLPCTQGAKQATRSSTLRGRYEPRPFSTALCGGAEPERLFTDSVLCFSDQLFFLTAISDGSCKPCTMSGSPAQCGHRLITNPFPSPSHCRICRFRQNANQGPKPHIARVFQPPFLMYTAYLQQDIALLPIHSVILACEVLTPLELHFVVFAGSSF
jgi:hypothetical protein